MRRLASCSILSLALVFSPSLGAGVASAQSGGGDKGDRCGDYSWSCEQQRVERFVKKKAAIVGEAQPAVFPYARITGRKVQTGCSPVGERRLTAKFSCFGSIALHERSTREPPEEYDPEWPIRQRTVRFCRWGGLEGEPGRFLVRFRRSRPLHIIRGWRMDCALDEDGIDLWNEYGPDYQPNASESVPYEVVNPPVDKVVQPRDDLLPAPSGEPAAPPPGPISAHGGAGSTSTARAAHHEFRGCSQYRWVQFSNGTYAVYGCFWGEDTVPGAQIGVYDSCSVYYEAYYWVGGNDWRFFQSGNSRWC